MILGIDASNLRGGGGLTHISELLRIADPALYGFSRITVWGGKQTLAHLPASNKWLTLAHQPLLDKALPYHLYWRRFVLPRLARRDCDVLFVPGGFFAGGFRPVVTMCRNMLPFESDEMRRFGLSGKSVRYSLLRYGQAKSFRKSSGVIFLTEYASSTVMKILKSHEGISTVIPHGISDRFRREPRKQELASPYSMENPFELLYVSIVNLYKHQWHVVEAVAELRRKGIPVRLDLIGPAYPPALCRLRKAIACLDPHRNFISYHGAVDYHNLDQWYHKADGFVFASSCENMPIILLEAMASGLPIACSNRGPMSEILGSGGIYFDPEKPHEIADSLRELITNSDLRMNCAHAAYARAQQYSWTRCAHETFEFLSKVACEATDMQSTSSSNFKATRCGHDSLRSTSPWA